MERDVQTEREMPRDISYYRERATQLDQVLFETSVVLNGGVPIENDWAVADLPRMVERVVQRAEAAESRVRESETELKEGDYWFKRLESFIANGNCPFCLASDCDGGHKPGCEMGEAEDPGEYWWKGAKSRVHELEIANASLIGAIDSAIIETRRLQVTNGELEAACAVMGGALETVRFLLVGHSNEPAKDIEACHYNERKAVEVINKALAALDQAG